MNKHFLILLSAGSLVLGAARSASARPYYPQIYQPLSIGYHISAKADGANIHFIVNLNATASAALGLSDIFSESLYNEGEPLQIKILVKQTPDKRKQLEFTVPKRLLPDSVLRVQSSPLRAGDARPNFMGYTLPLDDVRVLR